MLLVISPFSAIDLILAISQMVMSIIAAKTAKEITQYNHTISPPINPNSINSNNIPDMIPAPINRPIAAIASPLSFPLLKKAIRAIKANTTDVIPKVIANKYHGI